MILAPLIILFQCLITDIINYNKNSQCQNLNESSISQNEQLKLHEQPDYQSKKNCKIEKSMELSVKRDNEISQKDQLKNSEDKANKTPLEIPLPDCNFDENSTQKTFNKDIDSLSKQMSKNS